MTGPFREGIGLTSDFRVNTSPSYLMTFMAVSYPLMNPRIRFRHSLRKAICIASLLLLGGSIRLFAQGDGFTYQGRLHQQGQPPLNGDFDMVFSIWDGPSGNQSAVRIAGPKTNAPVLVDKGAFTTTLDFGSGVFTGAQLWLQIEVRPYGNTQAH